MRAVVQRVASASVRVDQTIAGAIGPGLLVLLGIGRDDGDREIDWMVDKILNLRIFPDQAGKMNRSLADLSAEVLIVSQFTLYGDCRKGRRPGYSGAAPPDLAEPLYRRVLERFAQSGLQPAAGVFGAMMEVALVNDGPVTLLLDSDKVF